MALSNHDREEISNTIRLVVNGNIKRVEQKLDAHIENHTQLVTVYEKIADDLKPVAEAVGWINTTRKFSLWISGFVLAIAGVLTIFK
jgi:hypothetical protein